MDLKMGKATREAFGHALVKLGESHPDVVVLDGDVNNSTHTGYFAKRFPERFFNVGIAESNLVSAASGLAACGKRAWLASFAAFITCNGYDQLRMSVAFPQLDVKVVGTHAGISIGEDGPAEKLAGKGVQARVLDMHTVKPLDDAAVLAAARETGRIVVAEEHLLHGGLCGAVAVSAARQHPVPMRFVALRDTFAESGTPEGLLKKYGLTADDVVRAAQELIGKK